MNIKNCRYIINIVNRAAQTSVRPKIRLGKLEAMGGTNPFTGEITINSKLSAKPLKSFLLKKYIRHELKHAEQFQIMARYFAGTQNNIERGLSDFNKMLSEKIFKTSSIGWIDNKYYSRVINKDGMIKKGDPLFGKAEAYVKAFKEYPDMEKSLEKKAGQSFFQYILNLYKTRKAYKQNLLEREAVSASKGH